MNGILHIYMNDILHIYMNEFIQSQPMSLHTWMRTDFVITWFKCDSSVIKVTNNCLRVNSVATNVITHICLYSHSVIEWFDPFVTYHSPVQHANICIWWIAFVFPDHLVYEAFCDSNMVHSVDQIKILESQTQILQIFAFVFRVTAFRDSNICIWTQIFAFGSVFESQNAVTRKTNANTCISRLDSCPVTCLGDRDSRLLWCKQVRNFGKSRENSFESYGNSCENLFGILAVVVVLCQISSSRGIRNET